MNSAQYGHLKPGVLNYEDPIVVVQKWKNYQIWIRELTRLTEIGKKIQLVQLHCPNKPCMGLQIAGNPRIGGKVY